MTRLKRNQQIYCFNDEMHPAKARAVGSPPTKSPHLPVSYAPYSYAPPTTSTSYFQVREFPPSGSILGPLLMAPQRAFVTPTYSQHEFARPSEGRKLREALTREIPSPDKTDTDSGVYTDSEQDEPMDLSCKGKPIGPFPEPQMPSQRPCPSPANSVDSGGYSVAIQDTSYLRDLLSRDRRSSTSSNSTVSEQGCVGPNTRVSLAKKNLLPVSARISDWLMKIVQFSESVPEFKVLSYNDKVNLVLSSWSRLLLLFMAENNFHFVVSAERDLEPAASPASTTSTGSNAPDPSVPTMKCVETIQTIIRKFQSMNVDAKEYLMLRIAVLFQCESAYLETPDIVSNVRHQVLECLRQHVNHIRPDDVMHYPKLLMSLPILYTVDDKMLERLFCKHITGDTDVSVLLKEMLNSV